MFDHFDLHVPAGQTVALVGRTGSGKSTVAELLPRFYDVRGGSVRIDGHDVRDLTLTSLRAHIGICFDEPFLFSVSVRDNIAYGRPDATDDEVEAAARAAGAHDFITALEHGYDTVVGERGYTLSGGQRQRVAIARTLLENPAVLILDDATSAIDVQVEPAIHDALRRLMAGRTTLIIAHRLSTISLAERVVLLEQGRVVASGTHLELMAVSPATPRCWPTWATTTRTPPSTRSADGLERRRGRGLGRWSQRRAVGRLGRAALRGGRLPSRPTSSRRCCATSPSTPPRRSRSRRRTTTAARSRCAACWRRRAGRSC